MNFLKRLFHTGKTEETKDPDGAGFCNTRHNAGFMVADALADDAGVSFQSKRYGDMAVVRVKNCELLILKPSTFMNLSGVAVRYWMNHEKLLWKRVPRCGQIDYVLGKFPPEEMEKMPEVLKKTGDAIKAFCLSGPDFAMNHYNK